MNKIKEENAILITAKGGNISIHDKHFVEINGRPLIYYPILAAKQAKQAKRIFLTTEDPKIRDYAIQQNIEIIDRPINLAQPDSNHGDVIQHAAKYIAKEDPTIKNVCILLGNTAMLDGMVIDLTFELLSEKQSIDSVMTVWKAQDDHPVRALRIGDDGLLQSYLELKSTPDTNRQSYREAFFYDQGPWTVRLATILGRTRESAGSVGPWWWMGERCFPIERPWITGRDLHTMLDAWIAEKWILEKPVKEGF